MIAVALGRNEQIRTFRRYPPAGLHQGRKTKGSWDAIGADPRDDRSMMLKLTRWTVAHRRIVILSWLVVGLGLLGASQTVGSRSAENFSLPGTNSQHALDLLKSRFRAQA